MGTRFRFGNSKTVESAKMSVWEFISDSSNLIIISIDTTIEELDINDKFLFELVDFLHLIVLLKE